MLRGDKPIPRGKGVPTPCWKCPKTEGQDVRDRAHAAEVSDWVWEARRFWEECRAVGAFPDDPTVRLCARVFAQVEDEEAERRGADGVQQMLALLARGR